MFLVEHRVGRGQVFMQVQHPVGRGRCSPSTWIRDECAPQRRCGRLSGDMMVEIKRVGSRGSLGWALIAEPHTVNQAGEVCSLRCLPSLSAVST